VSYGQRPVPSYARRVVNALTAPGALRPDGSGVGMTLAELVAELLEVTRENIQVTRENTAEVHALRADLKRRWGEAE
jgi:hypothetical protein